MNLKSAQFIDNLAWTRGGHVVKAGFSDTHYMNDQDSSFDFGGLYTFTSVDNFVLSRAGTFEGQAPGSTTARRWRQDLIGLYAQDDWTARRNLTLNLGVRYEFITQPRELDGRSSALPDLQSSNFVTGGDIFRNPSLKNVAPRAGFAWNVTGDGKNVVHGGAGMFFEPILSNIYRAYGNRTPPFYNSINPSNPPFPNPPTSGSSSLLRLDLVDYNLRNPYRVQYNASVQRELWGHTIATVGYIGARGYRQIRNIEYNQAVPHHRRERQSVLSGRRHAPQPGVQQHAAAALGRAVLVQRLRRRRQPPLQERRGAPGVLHAREIDGRGLAGGRQRRLQQQLPAAIRRNRVAEQGPLRFRHPAQLHGERDVGAAVRQGQPRASSTDWQPAGSCPASSRPIPACR